MHTSRPFIRRLTGGMAALALGATLTACGGDSESDAADDPTPAASTSAPADDASSSAATDEAQTYDDGAQVDVSKFVGRLQAGIDKTKYAHIDFTMGGAGGEMKGAGDVDYTMTPANMQMTMELGPQTVGMLLVGKTMYVQSSQAGEKYLKYDLDDPSNPLGTQLSDQLDPASSIAAFTKAVTSVVSVGQEDVDGRSLGRYDLTVDTSQLGESSSAAGLPAEMTITVWLDDQDRMAKTSMAMGAVLYDATLSDFDKAVELEAPPADQVVTPPTP